MEKINWGSNDNNTYEGRDIRGISLTAVLQHVTVNTAFAANPLDWSKIFLKIYLKRGKDKIAVYNDVAHPGIADSGFYTGQFQNSMQIGTYQQFVLQVQTAGLDAIIQLPGVVIFHDIINVKGDDELQVEIQVPNGAVNTAVVSTPESFMYYDIIEGIGVGRSIPVIEIESIRATVPSAKVSAGDNVVGISFLCTDKAGITLTNQVLTNMNISSDKLEISDDGYEILTKRANAFVNGAESDSRHQCFKLLDMFQDNLSGMRVRLNKVAVDLTFNQANVTAGKNYVVVRKFQNNLSTKTWADRIIAKHAAENYRAAA